MDPYLHVRFQLMSHAPNLHKESDTCYVDLVGIRRIDFHDSQVQRQHLVGISSGQEHHTNVAGVTVTHLIFRPLPIMRKSQANEAWQLASRNMEEQIVEEDDHGVGICRNRCNAAVEKVLLHSLSSNSA